MKRSFWLFKKLNLSLRTEVIINISFLMLAAILLIGFTTSKIIELSIIDERKSYGEKMIQDFQVVLDFMLRDKKELSLEDPILQKEIQNFVYSYGKEKGFYELLIVDPRSKIVASKKPDRVHQLSTDPFLKETKIFKSFLILCSEIKKGYPWTIPFSKKKFRILFTAMPKRKGSMNY